MSKQECGILPGSVTAGVGLQIDPRGYITAKAISNMIDVLGVAMAAFNDSDPFLHRVLLGKRIKAEGYGKWVLPGGKMDADETPEQAVLREGREEANLEPKSIHSVHFEYNQDDSTSRYLMLYYTGKVDPTDIKVCAAHEFSELRWFHVAHLPDEMWVTDRNAITRAAEFWGLS